MKVALIEDEVPALDLLERLARRVEPGAEIVARMRTVRETRAWLDSGGLADVVIADVELGDGLSLNALAGFGGPVIFTTAFDHYLLPALEGNGLAYLLKPVQEQELAAAFAKLHRLERHFLGILPTLTRELRPTTARLVGRRGLDWVSLPTAELAWVTTRHGGTWAMSRDGAELLLDEPLATVQSRLDPTRFYRANRWFLVSLEAILRVRPEGRGRLGLVLAPPTPEPVLVPQEGAAAFRSWFGLPGS